MKTFFNSRNESVSTDGRVWWRGTCTDAISIALNELQPVSALLDHFNYISASPSSPSPSSPSHPIPCNRPDSRAFSAVVSKARAVFISSLHKSSPTVSPADDAERAILRKAWDDAQSFAAAHKILDVGKVVFDHHLCVIGTADVVCAPDQGSVAGDLSAAITYCYTPSGCEFAQELNALVRILYDGLQAAPAECLLGSCDLYDLRSYSRAVTMLVLRDQTAWHRRKMDELPV